MSRCSSQSCKGTVFQWSSAPCGLEGGIEGTRWHHTVGRGVLIKWHSLHQTTLQCFSRSADLVWRAYTGLVHATNLMSQSHCSLAPLSLFSYRQQLCSWKRSGAVALPHRLLLWRFLWAHRLCPCWTHAEELCLSLPVWARNKWPVNGSDPRSLGWEEWVQDRASFLQEGRWDCSHHLCVCTGLCMWIPACVHLCINHYLNSYMGWQISSLPKGEAEESHAPAVQLFVWFCRTFVVFLLWVMKLALSEKMDNIGLLFHLISLCHG